MVTQIIFFLAISSGSVFCAAFFRRRYEELLPISCAAVVMLMFLFGVVGLLEAGFWVVLAVCLAAYIAAAVKIVKGKTYRAFAGDILTPAFFFFAACFAAFSVLNYGRLLSTWDEFSHWGDIVKAMVQVDAFGTHPASASFFQSYPPSMSIFQYFLEKLMLLVQPEAAFCEWRLYFAYQILLTAFFLPFLKNMHFKRLAVSCTAMLTVCALPLFLFPNSYSVLYIDPAMSLLAGAGLATVFVHGKTDAVYKLYVFLTAAMLTLIKDAGLLFSAFLVLAYFVDELITRRTDNSLRAYLRKSFAPELICGVCAAVVPKLLWSLNMTLNNASRWFTGAVDLRQLLMILLNRDSSYRSTLLLSYCVTFFEDKFVIGGVGVSVSFAFLLLLTMALLGYMYISRRDEDIDRRPARKALVWTALLLYAVYIFGLAVTYMFKFDEASGSVLTSYPRYMSIPFSAVMAMAVLIWVDGLHRRGSGYAAALLCVVMLMTPWREFGSFATRYSVGASMEVRQTYVDDTEKVLALIGDEPANIYVVTQDSDGFDWLVMMFNLRPNFTRGGWLGRTRFDGDTGTLDVTAQEWSAMLAESYDYVLLCHLNSYFYENYTSSFADAADIIEGGVYSVDKATGLLELLG